MRASIVSNSMPTSETRTYRSITNPLSRIRSSTSASPLGLGARCTPPLVAKAVLVIVHPSLRRSMPLRFQAFAFDLEFDFDFDFELEFERDLVDFLLVLLFEDPFVDRPFELLRLRLRLGCRRFGLGFSSGSSSSASSSSSGSSSSS